MSAAWTGNSLGWNDFALSTNGLWNISVYHSMIGSSSRATTITDIEVSLELPPTSGGSAGTAYTYYFSPSSTWSNVSLTAADGRCVGTAQYVVCRVSCVVCRVSCVVCRVSCVMRCLLCGLCAVVVCAPVVDSELVTITPTRVHAPTIGLDATLTVNHDSNGGNIAVSVVGDISGGIAVHGCPNDPLGSVLYPTSPSYSVDYRCTGMAPGVFQVRPLTVVARCCYCR